MLPPAGEHRSCDDDLLDPPFTCETVASSDTDCLRLSYKSDLPWNKWKPFVRGCQRACELSCQSNRFEKSCDQCGAIDRDFCTDIEPLLSGQGRQPSSQDADSFRYNFFNHVGDAAAFCHSWTFGDGHVVGFFRNLNVENGLLRLTNWYEDPYSPFSNVHAPFPTTPGVVYHLEARIRVDAHDVEFFELQFSSGLSSTSGNDFVEWRQSLHLCALRSCIMAHFHS